jgi:hypothetical protein
MKAALCIAFVQTISLLNLLPFFNDHIFALEKEKLKHLPHLVSFVFPSSTPIN